jgi:hypothetical protein
MAVTLAEALRVDASQARQFGAAASLTPMAVEPLPVPPRPQQATTPTPGGGQTGSQR